MGLDIHLGVNNSVQVFNDEYWRNRNSYSLSRTFCNFISRKDVLHRYDFSPELNQIGDITGEDISLLYEMENYPDENWERESLDMADNDMEREFLRKKYQEQRAKLDNNIDKVILLIDNLILKLSKIDNLLELLEDSDYDTFDLGRERYFSDFNIDKGDGYMRNNLGQDFRNFKRFLAYAKQQGTSLVYFQYG
jgi:hypothetical protein